MIGDELLKSQDVLVPALIERMLLEAGNAFESPQLVFAPSPLICCGTLGADPHGKLSFILADRVSLQPVVVARPSPFPGEEHFKVGKCP